MAKIIGHTKIVGMEDVIRRLKLCDNDAKKIDY